jgi:UDP-N-acetylglucosamine 2-epimerase (non-hydrolysing)
VGYGDGASIVKVRLYFVQLGLRMNKKKILLVFGTRPEAIKMAPVYRALKLLPNEFETNVCVTAQHRQMLDQVLKTFDITPEIDLNLMKSGQDLFDVNVSVLLAMRNVLREFKPDILMVHGDTTTTLASAMAGFYQGVPVGHVEAGLRTHNMLAPFPEEFNRQVTSKVACWHFAPTEASLRNLLAEGVEKTKITVTGNTVIDALIWALGRIESDINRRGIPQFLSEKLNFDWSRKKFILITGHRRENFGDGLLHICQAIKALAQQDNKVHYVYPVHPNPNVQEPVKAILAQLDNVHLIEPLDYEPFIFLLKHCYLVLTDSGGIQEEAPSLGKPVLVMRDVTERPEAVSAGTVRMVGARHDAIVANISDLLYNQDKYQSMRLAHNPYGDGRAAERIVSVLRAI